MTFDHDIIIFDFEILFANIYSDLPRAIRCQHYIYEKNSNVYKTFFVVNPKLCHRLNIKTKKSIKFVCHLCSACDLCMNFIQYVCPFTGRDLQVAEV